MIAVVIVTLGLFILIDGLVTWKWGADLQVHGGAVRQQGLPRRRRRVLRARTSACFAVSILSVVVLWALFQFTKVGLAMRAAALRPAAASLVGVRVNWMLALGWGLAACSAPSPA